MSYLLNGMRYTNLVCEPTQRIERLVFDLPTRAPAPQGLDVVLKFTMNGREWPASTPGRAGKLYVSPEQPGESIQVDLPTAPDGELRLKLPSGRYLAMAMFGSAQSPDVANYPPDIAIGNLDVVTSGGATINIVAKKVEWSLVIDGAAAGPLGADENAILTFTGSAGGQRLLVLSGSKADRFDGLLSLVPGSYTVELNVLTSKRYPTGKTWLGPVLIVDGAAPQKAILSTRTFPLTGRIRIDGGDLPSGTAASVTIGSQSIAIGAARPATFSGRLFPGRHAISFTMYGGPGMPSGTVPVATDFEAGPATFDITLSTIAFNAEVLLNGATLPSAATSRGSISVGGSSFDLGASVPATINGRLFQTAQPVVIHGAKGGPLPSVRWTFARDFRPTLSRALFDVKAGELRLQATYNGAVPPFAAKRGDFVLQRTDDPLPLALTATNSGPLTAVGMAPFGNYQVLFKTDPTNGGMPQGQALLGEVVVGASPAARTFDIEGTDVVVELRRQDKVLAPPPTGDRGSVAAYGTSVIADTVIFGTMATVRIPATIVAAEAKLRLFRGVFSIYYQCDDMCGYTPKDFVFLQTATRLP